MCLSTILLKDTLRFRPDRIILGEVRGSEARTLLDSFNTGHAGSLATIHANSAAKALTRFANLVMRSHAQTTFSDTEAEIGEAVDFVVHVERQEGPPHCPTSPGPSGIRPRRETLPDRTGVRGATCACLDHGIRGLLTPPSSKLWAERLCNFSTYKGEPICHCLKSTKSATSVLLFGWMKSTAAQVDQYAAFIHASADDVVDKALNYVFAKDRDFQDFLKTPQAKQVASTLRVRKGPSNGAAEGACKEACSRGGVLNGSAVPLVKA